jgi:hypothetical protein
MINGQGINTIVHVVNLAINSIKEIIRILLEIGNQINLSLGTALHTRSGSQ